jgi:topoisomerase-4 subunit B
MTQYTEENILTLDWKEHIRLRPGMYVGKLGDGSTRMMVSMSFSKRS